MMSGTWYTSDRNKWQKIGGTEREREGRKGKGNIKKVVGLVYSFSFI